MQLLTELSFLLLMLVDNSVNAMVFNRARTIFLILLLALSWLEMAQASNRWDILRWCTANTKAEIARCEGFLSAAVDLRTSEDFSGLKSCFLPSTRLPDVRLAVIVWLKGNSIAREKSGLALVARAIQETFPCSH
jgi:hypothetical protein